MTGVLILQENVTETQNEQIKIVQLRPTEWVFASL